jgi:hypothetical protein
VGNLRERVQERFRRKIIEVRGEKKRKGNKQSKERRSQ